MIDVGLQALPGDAKGQRVFALVVVSFLDQFIANILDLGTPKAVP